MLTFTPRSKVRYPAIPDNWISQTGYAYVAPDSNAHSGNLSLKFQTVQDVSGISATTLFTRIVPNSSYYPVSFSTPPVAITFWAITNLQSGDVLTINTTLKNGANIIGVVNGTCVSTVSPTWQFYSFPISYNTAHIPDSSATWFSFKNGSCTPNINPLHAGTFALIDDVSFDGATGINSKVEEDHFYLYPNPATGFTILNYSTTNTSILKARLFDTFGKLNRVFDDLSLDESSVKLNLEKISGGVYYLVIETSNGRSVKKIIIN